MSQGANPLRHLVALTLVVVVLFAGAGYWVAESRGAFEARTVFRLQTDSAEGLTRGMKVVYKGFRLGQLQTLELQPDGQVRATVEVLARHAGFFRQGATLKLSKDKIVTNELVLQASGDAGPALADGTTIALVRDDLTADLAKRVEPLLQSVNTLLLQLSDPKLGVQATLTESRQTMAQTSAAMRQTTQLLAQIGDPNTGLSPLLVQTRETMGALMPLAQQGQATLGEVERSLVQTRGTMQQSQQFVAQLSDGERGVVATLGQLRQLLEQLNDPTRGVGATLGKTGQLLETLDGTVKDVTQAPVYRFLVPRRDPNKVPPPAVAP